MILAEAIIQRHLEERIRQLIQINDSIASATKEIDVKSLEQAKSLVAGAVYALAVLKSEEIHGRANSTNSNS